jgi:hypothetical protein
MDWHTAPKMTTHDDVHPTMFHSWLHCPILERFSGKRIEEFLQSSASLIPSRRRSVDTMSIPKWLAWGQVTNRNRLPYMVATRDILARYLEGKMTDSDAASSIIETKEHIVTAAGSEEGAGPLWQFWHVFSRASRFVGQEQIYAERMVSLIYSFAEHPAPLNSESGEPIWSETDRGWLR